MRGVYRARVTRISGGRPYVTIPRLAGSSYEYGPLDCLEGVYTLEGLETEDTARTSTPATSSDFAAHRHTLFAGPTRALQAGDRVLVAFVEGNRDDPIIIGRLA